MTSIREVFKELRVDLTKIQYIGDGAYVGYDGYQLWLVTIRETGAHYIALELETMNNLIKLWRQLNGRG